MGIASTLRVALPCIVIGGGLGAIVGGALGSGVIGIRVGLILGGIVAFLYLRQKSLGAP